MEKKSKSGFINFMYWFFRIGFWIELTFVALLGPLNYFMYTSEDGLYFTVRGKIYAYEAPVKTNTDTVKTDSIKGEPFKRTVNKYGVATLNSTGSKTIYFLNNRKVGFMRIDYTDFSKAFTFRNLIFTLADILLFMLPLFITYQLMKILQSVKNESAFIEANIRRIKYIGWMVMLIPFIQVADDQLFLSILNHHLAIPGETFFSNFSYWDLLLGSGRALGSIQSHISPGILLGLIILVIAHVFKSGLELQKEKELTI